MKNILMKLSSVFLMTALLVACGKGNDRQDHAGVPQGQNLNQNQCINGGGFGCSWATSPYANYGHGGYPPGFQPYPMNGGYYSGFSQNNNMYNNFNACPFGSSPIYDMNYGLACVQLQNYQQFIWYMWGGQQQYANTNYGHLLHCAPEMAGSCMQGSCVALNQINNPGAGWNNPQYDNSGICQ